MPNPVTSIGRSSIAFWKGLVGVLALLYDTVRVALRRVRVESVFREMVFAGTQSVVIVVFVSLFTGIVLAMQSAYQLKQLGAVIYVSSMVAISMARELGPVFTALVVAGRVGSAITAQLGAMKVSEQIEALETLALDPVGFLVVPRFLALVIMLPCLTILADITGILGGLLIGVFNLQLNFHRYVTFSFDFLVWKDVWTGLVKSFFFAAAIGTISCYVGLRTRGGADGVGRSTTLSLVASFITIIVVDCLLTMLFYFSEV